MEQEQTPKQVQPEDTETIQIEERDAKRKFNILVDYLSQNNLGQLLRLAETLASQKRPSPRGPF